MKEGTTSRRSLHLLFISTNYLPKIGGIEIVLHNLIHELVERGHKVTLVTALRSPSQPIFEEAGGLAIYRMHLGVPHTNWTKRAYMWFPSRFASTLARIKKVVAHARPDLIMLFFVDDASLYACISKYFYGLPLVISFRGADIEDFPGHSRIYRLLINLSLKYSDAIVTPSKYLLRQVSEYAGAGSLSSIRATVIENGVDFRRFDTALPFQHQAPYALIGSRLVSKKGIDIAIRSFSELPEFLSDLRLLIAGSGPEEERLRQIVRARELQSRVEFLGEVSHGVMPSLVKGSTMLLLSSLQEPYGNIVTEAMAAGVPVIASNVGGIPERITHMKTGLLVKPGDHRDLAKAIVQLYSDSNFRESISYAGYLQSEQFDWGNQADKFVSFFREVLAYT